MRGFLLVLMLACCFQTAYSQQAYKGGRTYVGTELGQLLFDRCMTLEAGYGFSEHLSVDCLAVLPFAGSGRLNAYESEQYEEFEDPSLGKDSGEMLVEAGFRYWTDSPYRGCHAGAYMSYMVSGVPGMRLEVGYMMPLFGIVRVGVSASYLYNKVDLEPFRVRFAVGVVF